MLDVEKFFIYTANEWVASVARSKVGGGNVSQQKSQNVGCATPKKMCAPLVPHFEANKWSQ